MVRVSDDVVAGGVGVVVPFELRESTVSSQTSLEQGITYGNGIATSSTDGRTSFDVRNIARHAAGRDIGDGIVVRRRVNVSTLLVAYSLSFAIDRDLPDSSMSSSESDTTGKCEGEKLVDLHVGR